MDQMMLTYIITGFSGVYAVASIMYYMKNKRFIGRSVFSTIAFIIVFIMGIIAIVKGIPITQLQYLIETMLKK